MEQISAADLAAWLADDTRARPQLLDVREDWEWEIAHLAGAVHIPMGRVPGEMTAIDPDRPLVCICHHGMRSLQVALFLERHGFQSVYNLSGGVAAWAASIDPKMASY